MMETTTNYDNIDIKPNPIGRSTPLVSGLAADTGEDQFTVAAKLDAEIREEEKKRMMNPTGYAAETDPLDVVKSAAKETNVELRHPELNIVDDKPTTDKQAAGADQFSVDKVNEWDEVSAWANAQQPDDDILSAESFAMNGPLDAGSVNGDSDMTNQSLDSNSSLDFMNSIEPTPEQPGPEVDVVPDAEGDMGGEGESNDFDEDPSANLGDEI